MTAESKWIIDPDVADFVKSKTNNNVKSIDFDLFFDLVRERNNGISKGLLRDILEKLPNGTECFTRKIEFKGEVP